MRFLTLICIVAIVAVAFAAPRTVQRKHVQQHCVSGRPHLIHYDVSTLDDQSIVLLDSVSGLSQVECDISHTRLLLIFSDSTAMHTFANSLKPTETFVTASDKFDCVRADGNLTSFIMRRVMGVAPIDTPNQLELMTTPARYDEVIQDGTISVGPDSTANAAVCAEAGRQLLGEADKTVCLGVNSDTSCSHAAQSLPVYSNQYVNVQCSNCFLGVEATLFAELKISLWRLQSLAGGLKNIAVNGAIELDMDAHGSWSVGVDKTLPVVHSATILSFWVGPIPVRVWFEIPVEIKGDLSFDASAHASVGATASWQIGDAYVQWDPKTHWTAVGPNPHFSWQPIINGDAQFSSTGSFTLKPTVTVHLDNLFTSSLVIDPTLNMQAQGDVDKKQLCASLGYDVDITIGAELDINVSWLNIHEDKTFGPKTLYSSGQQSIGHWCV